MGNDHREEFSVRLGRPAGNRVGGIPGHTYCQVHPGKGLSVLRDRDDFYYFPAVAVGLELSIINHLNDPSHWNSSKNTLFYIGSAYVLQNY